MIAQLTVTVVYIGYRHPNSLMGTVFKMPLQPYLVGKNFSLDSVGTCFEHKARQCLSEHQDWR